ncbi:esterase/lipase family protein [Acidovorax sacchari]|uniref:esterase/lipase family protein n=1 Tax=Acidovorax sacchari TaxID=3230736 RepID=UPI0039E3FE0D
MTNARWQRWMVVAQLALAAGWLAWLWPRSPAWALAGAALWLAGPRLWLGLQFLVMLHANREDPVPSPSAGRVLRAWWAETRWASWVFGWWQPFRHAAVPDWLPSPVAGGTTAAPRGVVLVHGFLCNRGFWMPWFALLRRRGHAFVAVTLEPPFGAIDGYAAAIDAAVQRVAEATGRPPLVIGHSMGGLAVRAWLRTCGESGIGRVHRVVTLGTPHGGTEAARLSRSDNGRQMVPGHPWLQALDASEPPSLRARFTCFHSDCDNVVYPASTAMLAGADNRFVAGAAHVHMAFHPDVVRACLEIAGQP